MAFDANDLKSAQNQTSYIINHEGCPIVWPSRLQMEVALSPTEAEYVALSTALCECILLMQLIKKLRGKGFNFQATIPNMHCQVFEGSSGVLIMASENKMCPQTKHFNVKHHLFLQNCHAQGNQHSRF